MSNSNLFLFFLLLMKSHNRIIFDEKGASAWPIVCLHKIMKWVMVVDCCHNVTYVLRLHAEKTMLVVYAENESPRPIAFCDFNFVFLCFAHSSNWIRICFFVAFPLHSWTLTVTVMWIYASSKPIYVINSAGSCRRIWRVIFYVCTMTTWMDNSTLRNFTGWVCAKSGCSADCWSNIVGSSFRLRIDPNKMKLVSIHFLFPCQPLALTTFSIILDFLGEMIFRTKNE